MQPIRARTSIFVCGVVATWILLCHTCDVSFGLATPSRRPRRRRQQQHPSVSQQTDPEASKRMESGGLPVDDISSNQSTKGGRTIYSMPALYDLAFGYRNYEEEVDFLVQQHQLLHDGKAPRRVLELAAGPARHCLEALKASYVQSATAVDVSAEMMEYAQEMAREELGDSESALEYIQTDMTSFDPSTVHATNPDALFDSAWILLGSLQHLTTNAQVISCFQCIHNVLQPGATLILELPHPREIFSLVECTRNGWEVPLEDDSGNNSGELKIVWGDDHDDFDPICQVRQFTVSMELTGLGKDETFSERLDPTKVLQSVKEIVPMRHFTAQEIDVFARISGFEVTSMHGALASGVAVNDEDEAFRLVCVLQKKGMKW